MYSEWVVVFDFDDTLVPELAYLKSGIMYVEDFLGSLAGISMCGEIQSAYDSGVDDIWGWSCDYLGWPAEAKISLLWLYRLHTPSLQLFPGVQELIDSLVSGGAQIAILTDGRSISQRLKIKAVGLQSIPLFVSEDYKSQKPDPLRYMVIEKLWPGRKYVYIADNPRKDFHAPQELGWLTLGVNWVSSRIHDIPDLTDPSIRFPDYWCDTPLDVFKFLKPT